MTDEDYRVCLTTVMTTPNTPDEPPEELVPSAVEPSQALFTRRADIALIHPTFTSQSCDSTAQSQFEGIMMDNGVSKSPYEYPAYLRYCEHAGVEPFLRPSTT